MTDRRSLSLILLLVFISYAGFSLPFPIQTPLFLSEESTLVSVAYGYADRSLLLGMAIGGYSLGQFVGSIVLGMLFPTNR